MRRLVDGVGKVFAQGGVDSTVESL